MKIKPIKAWMIVYEGVNPTIKYDEPTKTEYACAKNGFCRIVPVLITARATPKKLTDPKGLKRCPKN